MSEANLDGLVLLLAALKAEGRSPAVLDRSWVTKSLARNRMADLDGVDYIVVEDATWRAWMATTAGAQETP